MKDKLYFRISECDNPRYNDATVIIDSSYDHYGDYDIYSQFGFKLCSGTIIEDDDIGYYTLCRVLKQYGIKRTQFKYKKITGKEFYPATVADRLKKNYQIEAYRYDGKEDVPFKYVLLWSYDDGKVQYKFYTKQYELVAIDPNLIASETIKKNLVPIDPQDVRYKHFLYDNNLMFVYKNPNGDSRTASKYTTYASFREANIEHCNDVRTCMNHMASFCSKIGERHDYTKTKYSDVFYHNLMQTLQDGDNFVTNDWYQMHVKEERHHLTSHCPEDVTLFDVLEMVADIVCAGKARSGEVYNVKLTNEILQKAYKNTVEMIKEIVTPCD